MAKRETGKQEAGGALVWVRPVPGAVGTVHPVHGQLTDVPMQVPATALAGSALFKPCDPPAPAKTNDADKEKS